MCKIIYIRSWNDEQFDFTINPSQLINVASPSIPPLILVKTLLYNFLTVYIRCTGKDSRGWYEEMSGNDWGDPTADLQLEVEAKNFLDHTIHSTSLLVLSWASVFLNEVWKGFIYKLINQTCFRLFVFSGILKAWSKYNHWKCLISFLFNSNEVLFQPFTCLRLKMKLCLHQLEVFVTDSNFFPCHMKNVRKEKTKKVSE